MKRAKEKSKGRPLFVRLRKELCPPGYYTSAMLRDKLGIDERQYRSLTAARIITSDKYNEARCALYSEALVQTLLNRQADGSLFRHSEEMNITRLPISPTTYTVEDSSLAFELFEAQTPLPQIVLKTRLLPQVVKRLQHEYDEMNGSITIPKSILEQMNQFRTRLSGPFPLRSATDILEVLKIAAEDRICTQCNVAACAELCLSCLRTRNDRLAQQQAAQQTNGAAQQSNGNGSGPRTNVSTDRRDT